MSAEWRNLIEEIEEVLKGNDLSLHRFRLRIEIAEKLQAQSEDRYDLFCELYSLKQRAIARVNNRATLDRICDSWRLGDLSKLVDSKYFVPGALAGFSSLAMATLIAVEKWYDAAETLRKANCLQRYKTFRSILIRQNHPEVPYSTFRYAHKHGRYLEQHAAKADLAFAEALYESLPRRASAVGEVTAIDFTGLPSGVRGKKLYLLIAEDIYSRFIRGAFLIIGRPKAIDVLSLLECLRFLGVLRFDLGTEFENDLVRNALFMRGVECEPVGPRLPQLNGAMESLNGKIKAKMVRRRDQIEATRTEILEIIVQDRNMYKRALGTTPKNKAGSAFGYDAPIETML